MRETSINRLTIEVPGWSEIAAHRLASALAHHLASPKLSNLSGDVSRLRVDLTASADVHADWLAGQIVSEVQRQLERLP
jgi:hypothetical protein